MNIFRTLILAGTFFCASALAVNPNPPVWPANVKVFTPSTPTATIQSTCDAIFATNGGQTPPDHGQFVNNGYALLFTPGAYTGLNINIGYYTSIMGLGTTPGGTTINSVSSPQGNNNYMVGALNSFWRSAENFSTTPALPWSPTATIGMTWAASQASPLRKINVNGSIFLFQLVTPGFQSGYSSGGFIADCTMTGTLMNESAIVSGSQQQWLTRNTDMSVPMGSMSPAWSNGVWSQVFVGCNGAPASHCSNCPQGTPPCGCLNCTNPSCTVTCTGNPYTTIAATPIIAEKPYITANPSATSYQLVIPQIEMGKIGTSQDNSTPTVTVDFSQVYVATTLDSAATINAQLNMGYHVILTPGMYSLTDSIVINHADTVVLGIGFPILVSSTGKPCIAVGSVDGVRVGGILLQAGPSTAPVTPTLLQWGDPSAEESITSGFLYDCFARVGRFSSDPNEPFNQTQLMVQINSANVVCDNLWLWRADHDSQGLVYNLDNACNTGMQVNGSNVTAYGLACEHTLQDLCQWNGDNGRCYFFQAEFPYDVTASYASLGYTGYRVGNSVTNHQSYAAGVYSFFRDHDVTVKSGIVAPGGTGIQFTNAFTRYLNGNGGIAGVLNGNLGVNQNCNSPPSSAVTVECPGPAYLCDYSNQFTIPRIRKKR
jgi:hypothetical protein